MTQEDLDIWAWLIGRSETAQVMWSYLTGRYWLSQGMGMIH